VKFAILAHLLGVVVWVGGMFFAYLVLRPAASGLDPSQRLPLWAETLRRFFQWVWIAMTLIFVSGFYLVSVLAGFGSLPLHIHLMLYIGVAMALIFVYVYFAPFRALGRSVAAQDWPVAGAALAQIRIAVAVNLALGLLNIGVATLGVA
jgi:uncharacterized membrane protein